jgi:hypothetical protein
MKKIFILGIVFVLFAAMVFGVGENSAGGQSEDVGSSDVIGSPDDVGAPDVNGSQGAGEDMTGNAPEDSGQGIAVATSAEAQQQNQGEETQLQNEVKTQNKIQSGEYPSENGKQMKVQEEANNQINLTVGTATATTKMQMTQEQTSEGTKLKVKLSNGMDSEVKIMPDTASEKALEQLKMNVCSEENGCSVELKEVGQGTELKAAYEMQAKKDAKFLGLFNTQMQVKTQVDAENGEVIKTQKPWWSFLASESTA